MPLETGTRVGSYEVIAKLGEGGMGEVYRARDTKLGRDVAVKILPPTFASDPDRLARFEREAKTLASLNHPNVAHVYGVEERALVMELVEGEDLAQRIARGAIPIDEALPIARQIADALDAAHEQGIIHRDLKPANIKVRPDGTVKVLDFGLAKPLDRTATTAASHGLATSPTITSPAMTLHGMILGTPAYMAPEQAKGRPVDKRADIWAFGCVLYEMLTGKRAFDGDDVTDTIAAIVSKDPQWAALPPATPESIRRLLARCLVKDHKRRLRDIGDAQHELLDDAGARPATVAPSSQRAPWIIAAAAAVAGILLAVPAISHWRERAPATRPLRATIGAPPQVTRLLSPDISPDGSAMLFSAVMASGAPGIWIRRFDEAQATPVQGPSGPSGFSFWSPDGRSFVYPARRGLVVHDLTTNSSRVVAEFGTTLAGMSRFSGTWSREGGIVFGVGPSIYRVGDTTQPQRVTLEGLPSTADNRFPVFLPDGRRFLFLSGDPGSSAIHVASLDGGPVKKLFAAESQATYVEPALGRGYLLFIQDGNLMARPFRLETMEAQGDAFIVAPDVPVYAAEFVGTGRGQFAASRDGRVVYLSQPNPMMPKLTWFDRTGKEVGTVGEPALYFGPRVAPDGRRVAVVRLDPRTRLGDIYVIDEKGNSQRLTFDPANDLQPVWTPSGDHVIFASHRNRRSQLFRKRADGAGGEELLYESEHSLAPDDVSANGALMLFRESHPITQNDLWVLPLDGSGKARPILQTEADEPRARFSPDGRVVTYISDAAGAGSRPYALSFPDLSSRWQISAASGNVPQWRRDGKEIYYQVSQSPGGLFSQPVLSTMPLRLGERVALFHPPITPRGSFFHASADGQRFLFAVEPSQPDLLQYHVATGWMK